MVSIETAREATKDYYNSLIQYPGYKKVKNIEILMSVLAKLEKINFKLSEIETKLNQLMGNQETKT